MGKQKRSGAQNRKSKKQKVELNKKLSNQLLSYLKPSVSTNELTTEAAEDESESEMNVDEVSLSDDNDDVRYTETLHAEEGDNNNIEELVISYENYEDDVGDDIEGNDEENYEQDGNNDCVDSNVEVQNNGNCLGDAISDINLNDTFNPISVIGKNRSHDDKLSLLKMQPCQPSATVLSTRKKKIGNKERCCSANLFCRNDGSKRSWLTYSLEEDALFCIPCLLFSDKSLRGENQRQNQGNAFVSAGFSNWKKQYDAVKKHEESRTHVDAKVSEVLFLQEKTLNDILEQQGKNEKQRKRREVDANRKIMMRILDTIIILGKQEQPFRGHVESLAAAPSVNVGNFLETLKYLAKYDQVIADHLEKVKMEHQTLDEKKKDSKKWDKSRRAGRGSKLTFLSNDTQNKLVEIIGNEIVSELVGMIRDCMAWALIADTTPDVSKQEQLSVCVRIVSKSGKVSKHLLFCTRVISTTAEELFNAITAELKKREVSFDNLVAQTYDGASNMSGRYNGLQARIKNLVGEHVIYTHCYAHSLNLVLSDTACASLMVSKLFEKLEQLYVLFSKSQPIHEIFELCQKELKVDVLSVKRINTVRWSSREFSLALFLKRYDSILRALEKVSSDLSFDPDKRSTSDGLLETFSQKQYIATSYLFREIFAITGPLSRILQSVEIDFGKALNLIDSALDQLSKLRADPTKIISAVEEDFEGIQWVERRVVRRKRMAGEIASDEPPASAEEMWLRDVFYVAIDCVVRGINERFNSSRHVLEAFATFSPNGFPTFLQKHPTARHVEEKIKQFCETYNIDSYSCANELFSFAAVFKRFNLEIVSNDDEEDGEDEEDDVDDNEADANHDDAMEDKREHGTFLDCLAILTNSEYKLIDAYPTLCRVYAIAVAIPVTSATAERSFSTLKRVKTRLRSSMLQKRLESLLLMSIERKILMRLDKERLINLFGKTSKQLADALL